MRASVLKGEENEVRAIQTDEHDAGRPCVCVKGWIEEKPTS